MIPTKHLAWLCCIAKILINAQNIFVVSMSPFRVKLGDFGISKRIQPQAATTFHTQVSTQIYGAPEVLGLDSTSETSVYTNSVDIWSLGCVIYELLAGTRLFASETQVSRYLFGKWPFPEDKLKELSPPTGDAGISLLKSMLSIQPEDRPTAEDALGNPWLVGLESDDEDSGDDRDETAQNRDESSWSRKSEDKITTHGERKNRRGQRNLTPQDASEFAPGDAALGANAGLQSDSDPTAPNSTINATIMTLTEVASTGSSLVRERSVKLGLTADASQLPCDSFQNAEEKTDPQCSTSMSPK